MQNVIQKSGLRPRRGERVRRQRGSFPKTDQDLLLKLYELLQGERDMIKVHSNTFDSDICFVNPALCDPSTLQTDCLIYTTRELAQVLSLTPEGLRYFNRQKK